MNAIVAAIQPGIQRCVHDKENPYLMLSVGVTRDTKLSVEDLGFLTILLDHPNNFKFNVSYLVKRCKLSKDKTRKLLGRLIEAGYVIASQVRKSGQFLAMIYRVFEKPMSLVSEPKKIIQGALTQPVTVDEKTVHGESVTGNLGTNEYDDKISTSDKQKNKNECLSLNEFKNLKIEINDQRLKNALLIRKCSLITNQDLLDAYLDEFNQKAEQYSHLSELQRIANFAVFIKRCIHNQKQNSEKPKNNNEANKNSDGPKSLKQAFFWAKNLCGSSEFASKFSNVGESSTNFESRIRKNLLNNNHFNEYKKFLVEMGFISS